MEHTVQTILEPRPLGDEHRAAGGQSAGRQGRRIGNPDRRQIVTAQQLSQHLRIHPIGLDLGRGDGAGAERIAHDQPSGSLL